MAEEDRSQTMWTALVLFSGTQLYLGRGGVNTVFYVFGKSGKRKTGYPAKVLVMLDRLAAQPYPFYRIRDSDSKTVARSYHLHLIKATQPHAGDTLEGVAVSGKATVVFRGKRSLQGKLSWIGR